MEYALNSYDHKVSKTVLDSILKNQYDLIIKKYHLCQLNITTISRISQINFLWV